MKYHPALSTVPRLSDEAREALKQDIQAHGQRVRILVQGDVLLDGRERLEILESLGIAPAIQRVDPRLDARALASLVASANLHRRHLTASQLAISAARLMRFGITRQRAELIVGVSSPKMAEACKLLDANPEKAAAVERGDVGLREALHGVLPKREYTPPKWDQAPTFDDIETFREVGAALVATMGLNLSHRTRMDALRALARRAEHLAKPDEER